MNRVEDAARCALGAGRIPANSMPDLNASQIHHQTQESVSDMQGINCRQRKRVLSGFSSYSPLENKWPAQACFLLALVAVPGFENAQASQSGALPAMPVSNDSNLLAQVDVDQIEVLLWQAAEQGNTRAEYEAYLEQYPEGVFAGIARARVERLTAPSSPSESASDNAERSPAPDTSEKTDPRISADASRPRDDSDQLSALREAIDADIAANRLTSPKGNNAREKLEQLEKIDPQDQFVNTRREQIRQRYIGWIERALRTGRKDRAEKYVNSLAQLPGSEQALAQARKDIANAPDKASPVEKQAAASTTPGKDGNPAAGQYPEMCRKPSFFKRTPAVIKMTNKTQRKKNTNWPTGDLNTVNLNDEKLWVYVELPRLSIRDYDVHMFVYDSAGKLRVKGNYSFYSKDNSNTKWTTWNSFTPPSDAPTGTWYMMMCEGGYRHVVDTFDTVRQ